MRYFVDTNCWLYEESLVDIKTAILNEDWDMTVSEVLDDAGAKSEKDVVILYTPDLGWNWSPELNIVNKNRLETEFTEIEKVEYDYFVHLKLTREDIDGVEDIIRRSLSLV